MLREAGSSLLRGGLRAWATRRFPAHGRPRIPDSPEGRELYAAVAAIPFWCHSIDLGMGVVTPGIKTPAALRKELASLRLPNLRGKSVLDVGAWDGFYSFTAERLGASRVRRPRPSRVGRGPRRQGRLQGRVPAEGRSSPGSQAPSVAVEPRRVAGEARLRCRPRSAAQPGRAAGLRSPAAGRGDGRSVRRGAVHGRALPHRRSRRSPPARATGDAGGRRSPISGTAPRRFSPSSRCTSSGSRA